MKARHLLLGLIVAGGLAVSLSPSATADTNEVLRLTAAMKAVFQDYNEVTNDPFIGKAVLQGHDLVNLALGTSFATLRTNEVEALVYDCQGENARIVVWDKTAKTVLATIAEATSSDKVVGKGRAQIVAQFDVQPGGNATYGLTGGYLTVSALVPIGPRGCIVPGGIAGGIGVLDVMVDGDNVTVLVPIAKLSIIRLLGITE